MIDVNGHEVSVVFARDERSIIARTCLQRPSDRHFAVGFVERIPFQRTEDKPFDELATSWDQLNFTTEDAANWTWWPTLREAVDASKVTFASFENWSANAPNQ